MKKSGVDRIRKALREEINRSIDKLKSPGHPRPYYISYLLRDIRRIDVWAKYGSIGYDRTDHKRVCFANVRVGSYRYDQTAYGGLTDNSDEVESYDLVDMPLEDDTDAMRFALWRLTDARYREAVKAYHSRKARDVSFLDENKELPSFIKQSAVRSPFRLINPRIDTGHFRDYVRKASRVFKKFGEIKNSYVEFSSELQTKVFVSSEGIERVWQEPVYQITAYMWYLTKKCNEEHSLVYTVAHPDELPDLENLKKAILQRVKLLTEIEHGEKLISYTGPVLMAPRPAGLFVHEVAGHRLEASRLLSHDEGRTFKDKVGHRIMHKDISIYDDPSRRSFNGQSLIGHYRFDDEGSVPSRAVLVERGVLKGFLTTRSPVRKKDHKNNGHARNQTFEHPISRMGNLLIESHSSLSWKELKANLLEEIRRRKLPYGVILYEVEGGETGTESYNFQAFMGQITVAVKVYPGGREKYIRGVDFVGTPLSSLSHIIAVGQDRELDNGFCGAESGTIPVSTLSPAILVSSLELQAKDTTRVTQYSLPLPWFEEKKRKPAR